MLTALDEAIAELTELIAQFYAYEIESEGLGFTVPAEGLGFTVASESPTYTVTLD